MKSSIRLSLKDDCIRIEVLNPKRITIHGFGSFLENYEPEEIEITDEARQKLLECPVRGGLQGMEFFAINILAWGSPSPTFDVPIRDINVEPNARTFIKNFTEVKK